MLVPEIALTPQLEQRVAQRFAAANGYAMRAVGERLELLARLQAARGC